MEIIDLSLPIKNNAIEPSSSKISYVSHKKGAFILGLEGLLVKGSLLKTIKNFILYGLGIRRVSAKDFPDRMGLAWEDVKTMTHRGTHLDAPWHFGPISEGQPAKTVEQVPLDWCYADGVVLDMRHKLRGSYIEVDDVQNELNRINYQLKPLDIVMIMTGADKRWKEKDYLESYPGLTREATLWILEQGVKIIGVDSYSVDRPSSVMLKDYLNDKNVNHLWPAHFAGRDKEYCHIEKLTNLEKLPKPWGFKVCCFPVLIENASAGWCRAVAIIA